jgi:hypothetical protein
MMKGAYPVAVANPVFLDLDGDGEYAPPGLPYERRRYGNRKI